MKKGVEWTITSVTEIPAPVRGASPTMTVTFTSSAEVPEFRFITFPKKADVDVRAEAFKRLKAQLALEKGVVGEKETI